MIRPAGAAHVTGDEMNEPADVPHALSRRGFLGLAAAGGSAVALGAGSPADAATASGGAAAAGSSTAGAAAASSSADSSAVAPSALMTGLRDDAVGVLDGSPRLWWQVPAVGASGLLQTGYEIQMTRDPRGFVPGAHVSTAAAASSSASAAVAWPFDPLPARSLASWRVRSALGAGRASLTTPWSAPARIAVGPLADADWSPAGTVWGSAPTLPPDTQFENAVFEASITIEQLRAGIFLRTSYDVRNGYMWQLNAGSPGLLRKHILVNGTYTVLELVTLAVEIPSGTAMDVRVEANGTTVTTSINGQVVDTTTGITVQPGGFGLRTGSTESFLCGPVTVTDLSGTVLYTNPFASELDYPGFGSIQTGGLLIGNSTAGVLGIPGPDYWALLRHEFALPAGTISAAFLHATAQSPTGARQYVYRAWCNGTHVGVGPARTQDVPYYQSHDISRLLHAGRANALAFQCWTESGQQFQALVDVYYSDGRVVSVGSDETWQVRAGGSWLPYSGTFNDVYYVAPNEGYVAANEPVGWTAPGYKGTDFTPAVAAATQLSGLTPSLTGPVSRIERAPAAVTNKGAGVWLIDTGKEITAGLRLTLTAPKGTEGTSVIIQLGEELNADGTVRYELRAQTTYQDIWTLRDGPQTIEHWGYRNFRWAQLTTDPSLDLAHAVTLLEQVVPQPGPVGTFTSSNAALDRVWGLCSYTIAANRQDMHMDSPTRERDMYEGDLVVHGRGEMANSRSYDIVRQTNRYLLRHPQWPTEYHFMSITTAWEEYLETGDPDALVADFPLHVAEQDESLLDPAGFLDKNPNLPTQDIVDWPTNERDGYVFENVNTVVNAWQYQAFVLLAQAAQVAGRPDLVTHYQTIAATMRNAVNTQLYDAAAGAYYDGLGTQHQAQHASSYSAALGVPEDDQLSAIAAWLVSDAANPVRVSSNAVQWLLEALYRGGRADAALAVMTSTSATSWLAMMDTWDATQTMEAWSPTIKSNTTFSHPWSSAPANIIPRYLLGVRVTEPGGSVVQVAPQPGPLAAASGTVATVRGMVGVDIEQSPRLRIAVTLPGNTTGTLRWPLGTGKLADFHVSGPARRPLSLDGDTVVADLLPGRTELTA
jgi:alpha-L-rhamnosidase